MTGQLDDQVTFNSGLNGLNHFVVCLYFVSIFEFNVQKEITSGKGILRGENLVRMIVGTRFVLMVPTFFILLPLHFIGIHH